MNKRIIGTSLCAFLGNLYDVETRSYQGDELDFHPLSASPSQTQGEKA
jgi:hypothetical protein